MDSAQAAAVLQLSLAAHNNKTNGLPLISERGAIQLRNATTLIMIDAIRPRLFYSLKKLSVLSTFGYSWMGCGGVDRAPSCSVYVG